MVRVQIAMSISTLLYSHFSIRLVSKDTYPCLRINGNVQNQQQHHHLRHGYTKSKHIILQTVSHHNPNIIQFYYLLCTWATLSGVLEKHILLESHYSSRSFFGTCIVLGYKIKTPHVEQYCGLMVDPCTYSRVPWLQAHLFTPKILADSW